MKIKKLLASVLSAAMLVGSIAVGNVSSALAVEYGNPITWKASDYSSTVNGDKNNPAISAETKTLYNGNGYTIATTTENNWFFATANAAISDYSIAMVSTANNKTAFTVNLNKNDKISVVYGASDSAYANAKAKTVVLNSTTSNAVATSSITAKNGSDWKTGTLSYTAESDDTYTFADTDASNRLNIYAVTITPVASSEPTVSVTRTGSGTLEPADTDTLTATATNFTGGTDGITYKWTSSNTDAATVTDGAATATVTAVATGTTNIVCVASKGDEKATSAAVEITVAEPGVAVVTAPDTLQLGYNTTVTATDPTNASAAFTFSGTNASATVAADGTVAALAAGDVVVTASATGVEGAKTITVVAPEAKKVPAAGATIDLSDLGTTLGRFNGTKSKSPIVNGTVIHDYITVVDTHSAANIAAIVDAATNAEDFGKAGQDTGELAGNFENYITYRIDKPTRYVQLSNNALGGLSFTPAANMQVTINYTGSSDTEPTVLQLLEGGLDGTLVAPLTAGTDTAGKEAVNYVANVEKDKTYTIVSKSTGKAKTDTANGSKPAHVNSITFAAAPLQPSIEIDAASVPTSVKVGETATIKAAVTDVELSDLEVVAAPTGKVTTGAVTAGDEDGTVKFDVTGVDIADAVTLTLQSKTTATVKDEATLAVASPELNATVSITSAKTTIDKDTNETVTFTADTDGFATDAALAYAWTASGSIAIDGSATGKTVNVKATKGGSGTLKVTVTDTKNGATWYAKPYPAEASVTVTATSDDPYVDIVNHDITLYVGQTARIPANAVNFNTDDASWSHAVVTGDPLDVATVSDDDTSSSTSVITALKAGTVHVKVTAGGIATTGDDPSETITVTVKPIPTITISIDPATAELTVDAEGTTFTATISVSDAAAKISAVEWILGDTTKLELVSETTNDDKTTATAVIKGIAAGEDIDVTVSASAVIDGVDDVTIEPGEGKATVKVVENAVPVITAKAKDDATTADVTIGDEAGADLEAEAILTPADPTVELVYTWSTDSEDIEVVGNGAKAKVTTKSTAAAGTATVKVTVSAKDNTSITPVEVEYTITIKEAETPAIEALTDVFELTAVLEDGTTIDAVDGVFALPEGTKSFNVVVKAKRAFPANSFTAALAYDATAYTVDKATASTDEEVAKLITADVLNKAVAAAADGKIVTLANFVHTSTDLVDVTIAEGAVLATFTFKVAAGNKEGAEFSFEAVEIANSDFADTVKAGDKAAIKVATAEETVVAEDKYYYLLADVDQSGKVDATDAAGVLTKVQRGINPFEGYNMIADVIAKSDNLDATDAATILTSVQRTGVVYARDDVELVDYNGKKYVPIDKELADTIIAYAANNGLDPVEKGSLVMNIESDKK